ncbi:11245_t:CDS:2 [Funneliformis geosporum]|uniref:11245_t:CDS:1 n=1 Tax=Funneliformis geosporum TaxID=1117311 RepID=A0A9W4SKH7_9GLOM|nr:11245_t:CDS:2 [Funneliformis geosporum]
MSQVENALNSLGAQHIYTETREDTSELCQQHNMNNNSEGNFSDDNPTEHMEFQQPTAPLSTTDSSTISSSSTLDYNYESSNSSTTSSSEYDTPQINPISFLNTMHQKLNYEPPTYEFSHDPATGHFYCQVNFCDQAYKNMIARPKKQQAKEDAAGIAMKGLSLLMPDFTATIRQDLTTIILFITTTIRYSSSTGARSEIALGHPIYDLRDDGRGYYLYDCTIMGRTFNPELALWQKNDAKDHVSIIAFNVLFREFYDKEIIEIQGRLQPYGIPPTSIGLPPSHPTPAYSQPLHSMYPNTADGSNYYATAEHASYLATDPNGQVAMYYSNATMTNASLQRN